MNCSRCSVSLPAMKPTTQIGNCSISASRIAAARCCPSTIHPGFVASGSPSVTGMRSVPWRLTVPRGLPFMIGSKRTR